MSTSVAAILLIALATYATRLAGPLMMSRVSMTPRIERFLNGLSTSVIAALVASILAQHSLREAAAVAIACVVALLTGSSAKAMLAGIALAAGWRYLAP